MPEQLIWKGNNELVGIIRSIRLEERKQSLYMYIANCVISK